MRIAVIGTGYVGLTAGTCLAQLGNQVTCVDNDAGKIQALSQGTIPIYEPGLETLVPANIAEGRLTFSADLAQGIDAADVIFICVGTPARADGTPDLSAFRSVINALADAVRTPVVVVQKSTAPVRTAAEMQRTFQAKGCPAHVAVNPEFLREGSAVQDFLHPDRVVIGTVSARARHALERLYAPLGAPILHTDLASAELIKHAANAFLSMKISYANLVARLCDAAGADICQVMDGIGKDTRIGGAFLNAGIGYGGYCFPKDLDAFIASFEHHRIDPTLLKTVRSINATQRDYFVDLVRRALGTLSGKTVGVLGLAFKPNTDDLRLAPSLDIIRELIRSGCQVKAYDPRAMRNARRLLPDITYAVDAYDAATADAVLLVTEWPEFRQLDLGRLRQCTGIVVDGRNVFDPMTMRERGFKYSCIGRGCT